MESRSVMSTTLDKVPIRSQAAFCHAWLVALAGKTPSGVNLWTSKGSQATHFGFFICNLFLTLVAKLGSMSGCVVPDFIAKVAVKK
jgi:hypothetical protein